MVNRILIFLFVFLSASNFYAGSGYSTETPEHLSTPAAGHSYDVLNYKINLDIRKCFSEPFPKSFNADVSVAFKIDSSLDYILLDANSISLGIDSVKNISGRKMNFTHSDDVLEIDLEKTLHPGDSSMVRIFYHHNDIADTAFYSINGLVYTDCEPEGARKWFPCWDDPSDKATIDLTASVPLNVMLGSNGRLSDSVITPAGIIYHWISREPMSTYLVAIAAKVDYKLDIVYWHRPSNPADSVPIRFYYSDNEDPLHIEQIIGDMTDFYSAKFGELPYEKNGFASLNKGYGGEGMENQTLTTICGGCWYQSLIAHEYGHQWFGDMITCGSWADLWINEGFAAYLEALYDEHRFGYITYKNDILEDTRQYFRLNPGLPVYNPEWAEEAPDQDLLFNNAITYNKGACVLHMLRYVLGDSALFKCLHDYATDSVNYRFKNVYTNDLITNFSRYAGTDLKWFFDEWIKQPNHPLYSFGYCISNTPRSGNDISLEIKQTQTNSGLFKMPVLLKISFSDSSDTLISIRNDSMIQHFDYHFYKAPVKAEFDPNNEIVLKQLSSFGFNVWIDPSNPGRIPYEIYSDGRFTVDLLDLNGQTVENLMDRKVSKGKNVLNPDLKEIKSGAYILRITLGNYSRNFKIILVR